MYDAENVEFKFSRLRRHLKICFVPSPYQFKIGTLVDVHMIDAMVLFQHQAVQKGFQCLTKCLATTWLMTNLS